MILFKRISYKNFLSTGNQPIEIDLSISQTTLIVGTNGTGKSTLLDALCFVLFNRPFRIIKKEQMVNTINNGDCIEGNNFPADYLEYKRVSINATNDCCTTERSMTVYLAEEANVDLIMRDPLKRPDFEWGETFCTMQQNTVRIYHRDFNIVSPVLTYYRRPRMIEIMNCTDPYTQAASAADVTCEFKDDVVELLIDEAVAIIAGDIDYVQQQMRGTQSSERNN